MVLKLSTGKSSKILIHGTSKTWHIPHDAWKIIKENHYEWTAHSHPTMTKIIASPDVRKAVEEKAAVVKAYVVGDELKEIDLKLGDLTDAERQIILDGCLINYYRATK